MIRLKFPLAIRRCSFQDFTVLVLLALVISWNISFSIASETAPGPSNRSNGGAVQEQKSEVDESLTSDEYIRIGMPAQDRDWFGDDMVKAEKILASLAQRNYRQLPRYKSNRSGDMFARLTSPKNLEAYKNKTLPFNARYSQALAYYQSSGQIMLIYTAGFMNKEVRDSELVELMGSVLRTTVIVIDLADEMLPTIKKNDPDYAVRMQGVDQMKRGLASVVAGGLQTLTERKSYRGSELARLVGYMQETFPQIVTWLPPGSRTETLLQLEKMKDDPSLRDLQPGLGELYLKVKMSVEKGTGP